MSFIKNISLILGVATFGFAMPAFSSSATLECRETLAELEAIRAEIEVYNSRNLDWRASQKRLFETSSINGLQWGHVFGEAPVEVMSENNEKTLRWFYKWVELSARPSQLTKNDYFCIWISSSFHTDIFEIRVNSENNLIQSKVTTE